MSVTLVHRKLIEILDLDKVVGEKYEIQYDTSWCFYVIPYD